MTNVSTYVTTNQGIHDFRQKETWVFASHWHEHLELHYIVKGEATFYLNQQSYEAGPGDFVIINSNELHTAYCKKVPYSAYVVIFDIGDISPELAKKKLSVPVPGPKRPDGGGTDGADP